MKNHNVAFKNTNTATQREMFLNGNVENGLEMFQ